MPGTLGTLHIYQFTVANSNVGKIASTSTLENFTCRHRKQSSLILFTVQSYRFTYAEVGDGTQHREKLFRLERMPFLSKREIQFEMANSHDLFSTLE